MSKNNNYTIPLVLAGIGLLLFRERNREQSVKDSIGESGYSEIEIWARAGYSYHVSSKTGISFDDKKNAAQAKEDIKIFLKIVDKIRKKFGFQELGEVYEEVRLVYNRYTKRKEKRIFVVNNIKDDQLSGTELGKLFLNELFKIAPSARKTYREGGVGIRVIKNAID